MSTSWISGRQKQSYLVDEIDCHSQFQWKPALTYLLSSSQGCCLLRKSIIVQVSGGIKVTIPQELDVVAFWSWNLDVAVFQFWDLVVAFCPLKKWFGITMSWINCLRFSVSRLFGLGISVSWCASTASFLFLLNLLCHIINVDMWVVNYANYLYP